MLQVRRNVFETNSSSTHSITICSEDEYKLWESGGLYWSCWDENFVSKEAVEEGFKHSKLEDFDDYLYCEGLYTFDEYHDIEMEKFEEHYTTKSGDNVIAFGCYGYNC